MDQRELESLKKEYKNFTRLEDKLLFWNNKLPQNYIEFDEAGMSGPFYSILKEFPLSVRNEDYEKFAFWVIKNYHDLSTNPNKYDTLLDLEIMKVKFEKKLVEEVNKLQLIRNELWDIAETFRANDINRLAGLSSKRFLGIARAKYQAETRSFEAGKLGIAPNYAEIYPSIFVILRIQNGFTLAKYWEFLKEKENEYLSDNSARQASLDQKLLLLYYLGTLKEIMKAGNASKQGHFLQKLIGNDAEKIRQRFSSINELISVPKEGAKRRKLKEDLQILEEYFKEVGLQTLVKKVQTDIRKLGQ